MQCWLKVRIAALCKLTALEEFLFNEDEDEELPESAANVSMERMRHCLLKLPNLHAALYKNPKLQSLPSLGTLTERALININGPCMLQLRQLVLGSIGSLPEQIALPKLQVRVVSLN
jgi:hypothetical protein